MIGNQSLEITPGLELPLACLNSHMPKLSYRLSALLSLGLNCRCHLRILSPFHTF